MAKVLVIGSGGREHALCDGLARSRHVEKLYCAPGNAGTAEVAENVNLDPEDHPALLSFALERGIDLTVVGPEAPLCAGIVDLFQAKGLRIFGPTRAAARIEGDKAYAKRLMKTAKVPTAEARIFKHYDEARDYVASRDTGIVVKAAGLAAGKGVFVCPDPAEALLVVERMMVDGEFGDAGRVILVEEMLKGQELSVFALIDDRTIYMLDSAQDHKAIGEGDTGPNTGGMGAYSPAPIATPEVLAVVEREVFVPIVDAMRNDGCPYRGLLYAGLMLTAAGPKVLEFNCRFGDPETQPLLMRLQSDLYEMLSAVVDGRLEEITIRWDERSALCIVMASKGYPGAYEKGKTIAGLEAFGGSAVGDSTGASSRDVRVFHAGTRRVGSHIATAGGRVLGVTALGADLAEAKARAYEAVSAIQFEGAYYRRDIGDKAIHSLSGRR
jgi:phosphoribosylamine---glycine ligase